jgi:hypothetical protein
VQVHTQQQVHSKLNEFPWIYAHGNNCTKANTARPRPSAKCLAQHTIRTRAQPGFLL